MPTGTATPRTVSLEPGALEPSSLLAEAGGLGLVILEGLVARQIELAGSRATELLGEGDLIATGATDEGALLEARVTWLVMEPARATVLDEPFLAAAASRTGVLPGLLAQALAQTKRLALERAVAQLPHVEDRLLSLLWLLAERHGRVTPDGVIVPLALRHRTLGELVGAGRSTVTLALGELERRGAVLRREEGGWVLCGAPGEDGLSRPPVAPERRRQAARARPAAPAPPRPAPVAASKERQVVEPDQAELRSRLQELAAGFDARRQASAAVTERARSLRDRSIALREDRRAAAHARDD